MATRRQGWRWAHDGVVLPVRIASSIRRYGDGSLEKWRVGRRRCTSSRKASAQTNIS
ncbi:MAG: hypothetical protein RLZZ341_337, partial [Pseudomonadota bacterium]